MPVTKEALSGFIKEAKEEFEAFEQYVNERIKEVVDNTDEIAETTHQYLLGDFKTKLTDVLKTNLQQGTPCLSEATDLSYTASKQLQAILHDNITPPLLSGLEMAIAEQMGRRRGRLTYELKKLGITNTIAIEDTFRRIVRLNSRYRFKTDLDLRKDDDWDKFIDLINHEAKSG